jgi:hypothetical protein
MIALFTHVSGEPGPWHDYPAGRDQALDLSREPVAFRTYGLPQQLTCTGLSRHLLVLSAGAEIQLRVRSRR